MSYRMLRKAQADSFKRLKSTPENRHFLMPVRKSSKNPELEGAADHLLEISRIFLKHHRLKTPRAAAKKGLGLQGPGDLQKTA